MHSRSESSFIANSAVELPSTDRRALCLAMDRESKESTSFGKFRKVVDFGLINGAMGTVQATCYRTGGPPDLPIAVMVRFESYSAPTFLDGTVPTTPLHCPWSSLGGQSSRLQLPIKLASAVNIHKSQGLTLDKVVFDVGKREFSTGFTFVACSSCPSVTTPAI